MLYATMIVYIYIRTALFYVDVLLCDNKQKEETDIQNTDACVCVAPHWIWVNRSVTLLFTTPDEVWLPALTNFIVPVITNNGIQNETRTCRNIY